MFLNRFQLRKQPLELTPAGRFLLLSESSHEALTHLKTGNQVRSPSCCVDRASRVEETTFIFTARPGARVRQDRAPVRSEMHSAQTIEVHRATVARLRS